MLACSHSTHPFPLAVPVAGGMEGKWIGAQSVSQMGKLRPTPLKRDTMTICSFPFARLTDSRVANHEAAPSVYARS